MWNIYIYIYIVCDLVTFISGIWWDYIGIKFAVRENVSVFQVVEVFEIWILQVFDFSGRQKLPSLSASGQQSVVVMEATINSILRFMLTPIL